jgi:hypothetical protein
MQLDEKVVVKYLSKQAARVPEKGLQVSRSEIKFRSQPPLACKAASSFL